MKVNTNTPSPVIVIRTNNMPIVRSITARCVCQVHSSVFNWSRHVHGLCSITRTGEQFADRRRKTPNYTQTKHVSSCEHNNNGKYGWKYLGIGSVAAIGLTGEVIYVITFLQYTKFKN